MVLVFLVVAATSLGYLRIRAEGDARQAALADAQHAAGIAATDLAAEIALMQKAAATIAGNPQIAKFLATPGPGCSLTFAGAGAFSAGHLDIIEPDGSVVCSSQPLPTSPIYAGAGWLTPALTNPQLIAPYLEPLTSRYVVVAAMPVAGKGVVAAFAALAPVGPNLAARFGGSRQLTFTLTTEDQRVVLAESSSSDRWVGSSLTGSAFARSAAVGERTGLDGRVRLFGQSDVRTAGWHVYAGADLAAALANANSLENLELAIIGGGLLAMLAAAFVIDRRISAPLRRLVTHVEGAAARASGDPIRLDGPEEVNALSDAFTRMIESVSLELSERRRAEEQARTSEHNYRLLFEASPLPMMFSSPATTKIIAVNDAAVEAYGYSRDEFTKLLAADIYVPHSDEEFQQVTNRRREGLEFVRFGPLDHRKKDGTIMRAMVTSYSVTYGSQPARFSTIEDVTDKERLERLINQSQRLDSLGQLAGGVAHDFNNLLGVMLNFSLFAKEKVLSSVNGTPNPDLQQAIKDIERVVRAGESAARLTHQLLAFARREVVRPRPLDVNSVVADLEPMVSRTIGEHIEFVTSPGKDLWPAVMDPGQLEQVLANLAFNARDAMPNGGKLIIDCENVDADDTYTAGRPGLKPGRYVRIRVTDTGTGMDAQTLQRVFEPFFTTKPKGQGTGLGLATVYGIVKQAGGDVSIYSEVGVGTRVHVLLPASDTAPAPADPEPPLLRPVKATATILLVEDADDLRELTNRILTKHGYDVLVASSGPTALEIVKGHEGKIHLLLTDVVMPNMQGDELANQVAATRPEIPVLYMSGYAQTILGDGGTVEPGLLLLDKPFTEAVLLAKVEQALQSPELASSPL
jgi:PAS domain S-box-containing protein